MIKKMTPIILSVALSMGSSIALADQSAVDLEKKVQPKAGPVLNMSKTPQKGQETVTIKNVGKVNTSGKNSQAVKASKKIGLTSDRKIIQRKGPGHVA